MKTIMGILALAATAVAGLAASMALAGGGGQDKVTLCHAAGLAGTTHYVTITVAYPAAFGPAGHFDENGTPNAGHEQDYLGACEGDETTPTTTTPTTTTPTTTTPTTPSPPTGAASVICDRGANVYRVTGTIDGQAADSVTPATIPGSFAGTTNVTVTRGDTSFRTSVTTNGDCGPPGITTTPPPANSTQPTTPPLVPPPDTTTSTPGGPAAGNPAAPPVESSTPGGPAKATPVPKGAPVKPAPGKPCPPGTRVHQGRCHATIEGRG